MKDTLRKSLTDFYKGLSHWLRDPDSKKAATIRQYPYTKLNIYCEYLFIHFINTTCFYQMTIITYIQTHMHYSGMEHERTNNE